MDLLRSQVLQPFPTPGSGTLWVAGEFLRDRRVSCLFRWTVCPTCSPSLGPNRSMCSGECSWSGPLVTPRGRCHRGLLTNGPGRIPPHCVCSGGADTVTGGGAKPPRLGPLPASPVGPFRPAPHFAVWFPPVGFPSLPAGVVVVGGVFRFSWPCCLCACLHLPWLWFAVGVCVCGAVVSLSAVVCGVWCVVCGVWCAAVVCWWGCGGCVVWLVPRHSWRRFLSATPRHSWLGFAAAGGVRLPATPGWGPPVVVVCFAGGGVLCCVCLWCVWVCAVAVLCCVLRVCGVCVVGGVVWWCGQCVFRVCWCVWLRVCGVPVVCGLVSPTLASPGRWPWAWFPATPGWGPLVVVVGALGTLLLGLGVCVCAVWLFVLVWLAWEGGSCALWLPCVCACVCLRCVFGRVCHTEAVPRTPWLG